jgi:WD40 repeat protein
VSTSWDRTIAIHDDDESDLNHQGEGPTPRSIANAHGADITCAATSHLLSLVATSSADFSVRVWDLQNAKLEAVLSGHTAEVAAVCFVEPYPVLASADSHGTIMVWGVRGSNIQWRYHRIQTIYNLTSRALLGDDTYLSKADLDRIKEAQVRKADYLELVNQTFLTAGDAAVAAAEAEDEMAEGMAKLAAKELVMIPLSAMVPGRRKGGGGGAANGKMVLVTGDESGFVKLWDIHAIFESQRPAVVPVRPQDTPSGMASYSCTRNVHRDYASLSLEEEAGGGGGGGDDSDEDERGGGRRKSSIKGKDRARKNRTSIVAVQSSRRLARMKQLKRRSSCVELLEALEEADPVVPAKAAVPGRGSIGDSGGDGETKDDGSEDGEQVLRRCAEDLDQIRRRKVAGSSALKRPESTKEVWLAHPMVDKNMPVLSQVNEEDSAGEDEDGDDASAYESKFESKDQTKNVGTSGRGASNSDGAQNRRTGRRRTLVDQAMLPASPVSRRLSSKSHEIKVWKAHTGGILSLQYVADPTIIVTSSTDASSRVWNLDGSELGVLTRSVQDSEAIARGELKPDPWGLVVHDQMVRKRGNDVEAAEHLLRTIRREKEELVELKKKAREEGQNEINVALVDDSPVGKVNDLSALFSGNLTKDGTKEKKKKSSSKNGGRRLMTASFSVPIIDAKKQQSIQSILCQLAPVDRTRGRYNEEAREVGEGGEGNEYGGESGDDEDGEERRRSRQGLQPSQSAPVLRDGDTEFPAIRSAASSRASLTGSSRPGSRAVSRGGGAEDSYVGQGNQGGGRSLMSSPIKRRVSRRYVNLTSAKQAGASRSKVGRRVDITPSPFLSQSLRMVGGTLPNVDALPSGDKVANAAFKRAKTPVAVTRLRAATLAHARQPARATYGSKGGGGDGVHEGDGDQGGWEEEDEDRMNLPPLTRGYGELPLSPILSPFAEASNASNAGDTDYSLSPELRHNDRTGTTQAGNYDHANWGWPCEVCEHFGTVNLRGPREGLAPQHKVFSRTYCPHRAKRDGSSKLLADLNAQKRGGGRSEIRQRGSVFFTKVTRCRGPMRREERDRR